jgi:hypothetical protein
LICTTNRVVERPCSKVRHSKGLTDRPEVLIERHDYDQGAVMCVIPRTDDGLLQQCDPQAFSCL